MASFTSGNFSYGTINWRKVLAWLAIALVGASFWLFQDFYFQNKEVKKYQVVATASEVSNFLLPISRHIKDTPRPEETFPFPIALGKSGPVQSLYSGPNQYPFYCMTREAKLGQPIVDNQQGFGVRVYNEEGKVIGFSKDCSIASQLSYYMLDDKDQVNLLTKQQVYDLTNNKTSDRAKNTKLIFRVEQGTINRFIYTLIMPIDKNGLDKRATKDIWNGRLIYQFNGGSGIGYRQGRVKVKRAIEKRLAQLKLGYAVASSTGNRTSYTYNMLLAEDTMRRVKHHFSSLYGQPVHTIGIGGSGGAIAQYLIAQNAPDLLDAIIPQYSYPDMVSQTIYALDCDLFNNYYTFRADKFTRWQSANERELIEGMNSSEKLAQRAGFLQPVNQVMAGVMPVFPEGNSECINGWFGLSTFINNPRQGFLKPLFSMQVVKETHWSYWQDMAWLLGKTKHGFARTTWSNEGVQYGLKAFINDRITRDEFLHLNRHIGSWELQHRMAKENILTPFGRKVPLWLSLWGTHNITQSSEVSARAPRYPADLKAIKAIYRGGQVFIGDIDLPIIDLRHYLEDELDMHHISASFSTRARLTNYGGNSDQQLIWIAHKEFNPEILAFEVLEKWLSNLQQNSHLSVSLARPEQAQDMCFNKSGSIIAQGKTVWDGSWNDKPKGACSKIYPSYTNSRIEAGSEWAGSVFACHLVPVEQALANGLYQDLDISSYIKELKAIFPNGVCDYSQGDKGMPDDLKRTQVNQNQTDN